MESAGWLTLLGTSGLLGFILRPAIERTFTRFFRPRLVIEFPGGDPGCEVPTPVEGTTEPTQNHLRIRLRNRGRTTAQKVAIYGADLRHWIDAGTGDPDFEFREEVLDLHLALSDVAEFRLAPGAHRFVDLCHVVRGDSQICWDFVQKPLRLYNRKFGAGRYRLR